LDIIGLLHLDVLNSSKRGKDEKVILGTKKYKKKGDWIDRDNHIAWDDEEKRMKD